jgi:hypothetical protein
LLIFYGHSQKRSRGLLVGYLVCEPTASFDLDEQIGALTTDLIRQLSH